LQLKKRFSFSIKGYSPLNYRKKCSYEIPSLT
jgi:hypothetical protein